MNSNLHSLLDLFPIFAFINKMANLKLFSILVLLTLNHEFASTSPAPKQLGQWPTLTGEPTLLNAHRGETVLVPENTLASTQLGAILGADHIELDLAVTRDGVLVVYHDLTLRASSNVASLPQFALKMRNYTGVVDEGGSNVTITNNWLIDDFTLAELRQLGVRQRNVNPGIRPKLFDGLLSIPTFDEFLSDVHHISHGLNKSVGIVVELKQPMFHNFYYNSTPRYMEDSILATLGRFGYPLTPTDVPNCRSDQDGNVTVQCGNLIIQSFELTSMEYLHSVAPFVEKSILINRQLPLLTVQGFQNLSTWITYYSPWKELLYTGILAQIEKEGIEYDEALIDDLGGFIHPQEIVPFAHNLGVKVFIYTIYDSRENSRRGCMIECEPQDKELELFYYFDQGVDGIFGENMMENREIRMKYQYERINAYKN